MFPRDFRRPKEGKSKSIFEIKGQKGSISGASAAAFLGGSWGFFGALGGVLEGFRPHSPLSHENSPLPALWCNRFLGLLAKIRFKGILRGFIWVYVVGMYIWLSCGFRGACGALCVYC